MRSPSSAANLGLKSCKSSLEQVIGGFDGFMSLWMTRAPVDNVDIVFVAQCGEVSSKLGAIITLTALYLNRPFWRHKQKHCLRSSQALLNCCHLIHKSSESLVFDEVTAGRRGNLGGEDEDSV